MIELFKRMSPAGIPSRCYPHVPARLLRIEHVGVTTCVEMQVSRGELEQQDRGARAVVRRQECDLGSAHLCRLPDLCGGEVDDLGGVTGACVTVC